MFSSRFTTAQSSAVRKSRVEGKPSMLPKPRRPGSTDRASVEARRPSVSQRSSSAEPARATLGGRLSREASATKLPKNRISKSHQGERAYGQSTSTVTPLRTNHYRTTTTPVRTPSEDRMSRSWQASVERALAFLTIKDQRPISTVAWQRAQAARVSEALGARGQGAEGAPALIRPLTIARFVDIAGGLLAAIMYDTKLNSDNYVAKLPNLAKKFLYPGTVSKSWLKTVNTLHAFPHALAFIAYFLDLVNHIEAPVSYEWLYLEKDELACLRRDYLYKCWIRFQDMEYKFDDLNQEYLQQLKALLGDDEQKVVELKEIIEKCEATLEDESELAARAEEEHQRGRRDALSAAVRAVRAERRHQRAAIEEHKARRAEHASAMRALDADIASATSEIQQLKKELESQTITVAERSRLLDEVDYATRVIDSKRTLAEQVSKMVLTKETELAHWQKRTLDSCVEYKQGLIHLSAQFPELAALAVDEKELMDAACAAAVCSAVGTLRAHAQRLADLRAERARTRTALARQRSLELEETRAKIQELKATIEREQQALESESGKESAEAAAWAGERQRLAARLHALRDTEDAHAAALGDLQLWEKQDAAWRARLAEMFEYIDTLREKTKRDLEVEKKKRADVIKNMVAEWHRRLDEVEREEKELEDSEQNKRERDGAKAERAM